MVLETSCHGFMWLKIKEELFCFQEDVILGHVYFPGPNSNVLRQQGEDVDHFDLLENHILQYKNQGKLFISGDFNSRCVWNAIAIFCCSFSSCLVDWSSYCVKMTCYYVCGLF